MRAPSSHFKIVRGDASARIDPMGASLASLVFDNRELIVGYSEGELRPLFRGALLIPWPNRIADGSYEFGGRRFHLPVNEVQRGNALHGLISDMLFTVVYHRNSRVRLTGLLESTPGYPWPLRIVVDFVLTRRGLVTAVSTQNLGTTPAPYGVAPHPYLRAGRGNVDDWIVHVPAARVLNVDEARLLPTGLVNLDSNDPRSLQTPTRMGDREIDHAYTSLPERAVVTVKTEEGTGVYMEWRSARLPWVQIHTADHPEPANHRIGLAVEPMSCPPDAFRSRSDLVVISPRSRHRARWTIGPIDP